MTKSGKNLDGILPMDEKRDYEKYSNLLRESFYQK